MNQVCCCIIFLLLWLIIQFGLILSDPGVRDSSAEALGTAMKVVGEKLVMPFLPDLEAMKMAKIKEFCEKAVIAGKPAGGSKPKSAQPPNEAKDAAVAKPAEAPKRPGPVIKKPGATTSGSAGSSGGSSAPAKKNAGKPAAKKPAGAKATEEKVEKELSQEEVDEKAAALLPPDVISGLTDSNWKTRLAAMESIMQVLSYCHSICE